MCGSGKSDPDDDPTDPDNLGPRVRKLIRKEDVAPWKGDYGRWNFVRLLLRVRTTS